MYSLPDFFKIVAQQTKKDNTGTRRCSQVLSAAFTSDTILFACLIIASDSWAICLVFSNASVSSGKCPPTNACAIFKIRCALHPSRLFSPDRSLKKLHRKPYNTFETMPLWQNLPYTSNSQRAWTETRQQTHQEETDQAFLDDDGHLIKRRRRLTGVLDAHVQFQRHWHALQPTLILHSVLQTTILTYTSSDDSEDAPEVPDYGSGGRWRRNY